MEHPSTANDLTVDVTTTLPPKAESAAEEADEPSRLAYLKHRRGSRWMHWINFPLLTIMVWSGLRIYWANDVYDITIGGWQVFNFFPDAFNEKLNLDRKLAKGMAFHLAFGWLFALNGVAYGLYSLKTREWRKIAPDRHSFRDAIGVVRHELHLGGDLPPQPRYNAAQRLTYSAVIWMGALVVLTGLVLFKPVQLSWLTSIFGGYETARAIHFIVTIGFVLFFVLHLFQVIRAGWSNFASMVTGYELESVAAGKSTDKEEAND